MIDATPRDQRTAWVIALNLEGPESQALLDSAPIPIIVHTVKNEFIKLADMGQFHAGLIFPSSKDWSAALQQLLNLSNDLPIFLFEGEARLEAARKYIDRNVLDVRVIEHPQWRSPNVWEEIETLASSPRTKLPLTVQFADMLSNLGTLDDFDALDEDTKIQMLSPKILLPEPDYHQPRSYVNVDPLPDHDTFQPNTTGSGAATILLLKPGYFESSGLIESVLVQRGLKWDVTDSEKAFLVKLESGMYNLGILDRDGSRGSYETSLNATGLANNELSMITIESERIEVDYYKNDQLFIEEYLRPGRIDWTGIMALVGYPSQPKLDGPGGFTQSFDFPPEISTACTQYLLVFQKFLHDIGIESTTTAQNEAGKVLFSVTPKDTAVAIETIHEALRVFLGLPQANITVVTDNPLERVQASEYKAEIAALVSRLELARATIELKGLIEAEKDKKIAELTLNADHSPLVPKAKKDDKEFIFWDTVSVKPLDLKVIEINFPEFIRKGRAWADRKRNKPLPSKDLPRIEAPQD